MPGDTNGTTIGFWYSDDETIVDDFDSHFGSDNPGYSRSQRIKDAMRLALAVDKAFESRDVPLDIGTREGRNAVTGAVHNEFRE